LNKYKLGKNVTLYGLVYIKDGVEIGDNTKIGELTYVGKNCRIGKNCSIMYHTLIGNGTIIGNNVFIGGNTTLVNDKYPPTTISQPVYIDDDVIIGSAVTILPNVKVGCKAVVGAGSLVTHDVPAGHVVYGHPAKFKMTREEYDEKQKKQSEQ